jgi:hypothetical protein
VIKSFLNLCLLLLLDMPAYMLAIIAAAAVAWAAVCGARWIFASHLAGIVFEAVAVLGVFAVDLLTGQVVARMDKRERNKLAKAA